jgi:two-component system CheB/CheR fusion protein
LTGVDFTHYRQTTILRRIQRRMVVHKIDSIDEYAVFVQSHPAEVRSLYQDMLINVTSFFRTPGVFEALKSAVFPVVQKSLSRERGFRIWTPGCASGEETYSVAISLLEFLAEDTSHVSIQFFGTDVSELSVAKARNAVYPENIQGDVSQERLRRFFTRVEGGYRVSKAIRDMCIFAQHNVLNDPPFPGWILFAAETCLSISSRCCKAKSFPCFTTLSGPGAFSFWEVRKVWVLRRAYSPPRTVLTKYFLRKRERFARISPFRWIPAPNTENMVQSAYPGSPPIPAGIT